MRERIPTHLVTQVRNRDALVKRGWIEGRDFTAIDSERVARPLWRVGSFLRGGQGKGWTTVMALNAFSYYYFEHLLWKQFGPAIRRGEFDIVHRLTPLSPTIPSLIAGRCAQEGVPFVLGPMNGGLPWPKQFRSVQAQEREWLSTVRDLCRYMPYWRSTYQNAAVVISGSRDTRRQLEPVTRHAHITMTRNGVDVKQFEFTRRPGAENPSLPLHLLFVGRLVPYKGCDMVLEAAATLLRSGAARLTIAGEGPQRPALEAMVEQQAIPGVRFLGDVPNDQLQRCFAEADVLAFPSIREFGGAVVLEAMSCGVPVIVVDYGGPGELASNECGRLIPLGDRSEIVQALHRAINELDADRPCLGRMGEAARRRAEQMFDWTVKAKQLIDIYEWALGRSSRPEITSADLSWRVPRDRSRKVEQLA
jgi:glycosyltransferase involved in cell wall biosynthesis